jgi:nitroimidazol reductase NimA-like FMN-containing flavoprotein (pyridoxamine 5'-phosphate oxidase superfamily)
MRRKEKEITDRMQIDAIIKSCIVCRLAMADGGQPYIVPLCFGYRGNILYFHTARAGRKLEILRENPRVCFEFESGCELKSGETACKWSMRYRSVIGTGTASFVEAPADKRQALDLIMQQYTTGAFEYPEAILAKIMIIKVDIDEISGKVSD